MSERFHFKRLDRVRRLLREHLPEIASIRVTLKRPGYAGLCMKYVSDFEAELQQAGALDSSYGRRKPEDWQVVFEAVDAWVLEAVQAHLVEAGLQSAVYQIRIRVGTREPAQSLVCTDLDWTGPSPEEAARLAAAEDDSGSLEPVLVRTLEAQQEQNRQLMGLLQSRLSGERTGAATLRERIAVAGGPEAWVVAQGLDALAAGLLDSIIEGPLGPVLSEKGLVTLLGDPQAATAMSMQLLELAVQLRSGSVGLRLLPSERREA
ncbi:MAG: hypothetical protein VX899_08050 [Myxococcota bacterium]|nr:hypothetical protein [Myxococcota bacterium]